MIAYIDCFSGISGDMTLGAFVDIGVPVDYLQENLRRIPLTGFEICESRVQRHGISATDIRVEMDNERVSRDYATISATIKKSPLSERVKQTSLNIFEKIAVAEAAIHDCPMDRVHFHEVGGVDAIVDIVGTALCTEYLGIRKVVGSRVPLGRGFVTSRHGVLPVPAPATLSILKGIPVYGTDIDQELVTPTGAAILAALCAEFSAMPGMAVEKIGYGAGKREHDAGPNLLRIVMGQEAKAGKMQAEDDILVVETGIDDMNPEIYGYVMERLFADGALDVFWTPVYMKKNRPGTLMTVLCTREMEKKVIHRILSETTSAGVRSYPVRRHILHRELLTVDTTFGPTRVKRIVNPDGVARLVPEYEVCREIALKNKVPVREVYDTIIPQLLNNDGGNE